MISSDDADDMERNLTMLAAQFEEPEQELSPGNLMINTRGSRDKLDRSNETLETLAIAPMPPAMAILNNSSNTVKLVGESRHKQQQDQLEELMKKNVFRSGLNDSASGYGLAMKQPQVVSLDNGLDISITPPHETELPEYIPNNIQHNNLFNLNNVNEEVLVDNIPISWPQVVSLEHGLEVSVTPPQSEQHVECLDSFHFTHLNSINHRVLDDNIEGTQSEPQYSSLANLFLNPNQATELSITASGEVEHVANVLLPVTPSESLENIDDNMVDKMETEGQVVKTRKKRGINKRKERVEEIKAEKTKKKISYDEAIRAYKAGAFTSYRKCAEHYGVNNSVLRKYILSGTSYVGKGMVNQVLTDEELKDLRDHLVYMAEIGFGYTIYDLRLDLQQLLTDIVRYGVTFLLFYLDLLRSQFILLISTNHGKAFKWVDQ